MTNEIIKDGIKYEPGKTYFVAGGRSAWDTVPVGLFNTYNEAANSFPDHKPETFVRKATDKEVKQFFNL